MLFIKDGFLDGRELLNNMMKQDEKKCRGSFALVKMIYI